MTKIKHDRGLSPVTGVRRTEPSKPLEDRAFEWVGPLKTDISKRFERMAQERAANVAPITKRKQR